MRGTPKEGVGADYTGGSDGALTATLAKDASTLGIRHRLPLAHGVVYATAQSPGTDVWTQDKDFDGLPGVRCLPK
jgi:hypothetical protein